jgi:hypothetical protein
MKRIFAVLGLIMFSLAVGMGIAFWQHSSGVEFASPKEAVNQLVTAMRSEDIDTLRVILAPDPDVVIHSGDHVADRYARRQFVAAYDAHERLMQIDPAHAVLLVGKDNFRFPIPLAKKANGRWFFDTAAGRDELRARRIGHNELYIIRVCKAYVDAQREYASIDRGDGVLDYAQHFISTKGSRDGLYWPATPSEPQSPLGPLAAEAEARGYVVEAQKAPRPFNGYYFRILNAQGWSARGGAYSYVAYGKMIGGFGMIAYPARYRVSGVATFIVNQDGVVYQRDLGLNTAAAAANIAVFNPDAGWTKA